LGVRYRAFLMHELPAACDSALHGVHIFEQTLHELRSAGGWLLCHK